MKAQNDFGKEPVKPEKKADMAANETQFTYSFPDHSFTMLKGRIVRR